MRGLNHALLWSFQQSRFLKKRLRTVLFFGFKLGKGVVSVVTLTPVLCSQLREAEALSTKRFSVMWGQRQYRLSHVNLASPQRERMWVRLRDWTMQMAGTAQLTQRRRFVKFPPIQKSLPSVLNKTMTRATMESKVFFNTNRDRGSTGPFEVGTPFRFHYC